MTDEVLYALPLGLLGRLMHSLVVKKKSLHIFLISGRTPWKNYLVNTT